MEVKRKALYFGILVMLIGLFAFTFVGVASLNRDVRKLGNEYLYLAISPDMDNAILYLDKYREAIEENGFTTGSCGRYYKTIDNEMSYRYQKLVTGIEYLRQLNDGEGSEADYSNFRAVSTVSGYVKGLDIGILNYLTANNIGRLFQSWINGVIVGILMLGWFIGGHRICFPDGVLWWS